MRRFLLLALSSAFALPAYSQDAALRDRLINAYEQRDCIIPYRTIYIYREDPDSKATIEAMLSSGDVLYVADLSTTILTVGEKCSNEAPVLKQLSVQSIFEKDSCRMSSDKLHSTFGALRITQDSPAGLLLQKDIDTKIFLQEEDGSTFRYVGGEKCGVANTTVTPGAATSASQNGQGVISIGNADYGANCGAPEGNHTEFLSETCNGRTSCSYTVQTAVTGDPAFGCAKDFNAKYYCGNRSSNRRSLDPEADGQTIELTCD